jgi:hypothetical protein
MDIGVEDVWKYLRRLCKRKSNMSLKAVPSAPLRTFRSIILDKDLEIILESEATGKVTGLNLPAFAAWLSSVKKGNGGGSAPEFILNETFRINPSIRTIFIRGYKIADSESTGRVFFCSPLAQTWTVISYKSFEPVLTALEYVYHMETCI